MFDQELEILRHGMYSAARRLGDAMPNSFHHDWRKCILEVKGSYVKAVMAYLLDNEPHSVCMETAGIEIAMEARRLNVNPSRVVSDKLFDMVREKHFPSPKEKKVG